MNISINYIQTVLNQFNMKKHKTILGRFEGYYKTGFALHNRPLLYDTCKISLSLLEECRKGSAIRKDDGGEKGL